MYIYTEYTYLHYASNYAPTIGASSHGVLFRHGEAESKSGDTTPPSNSVEDIYVCIYGVLYTWESIPEKLV